MRREVTYRDAERYVKLLPKRWGKDVFELYGKPVIRENWAQLGDLVIIWEGPFEWTVYSTINSLAYAETEPEFGIHLPIVEIPRSLSHIFSEPVNGSVLALYLN